MKCCKSFLKALALVGVVAFVSSAAAATKTWVGKKAYNASRADNWDPAGAPVDGDDIVFDSTSDAGYDCTWDIDIKPASWRQNGYTKKVTFQTEFDEYEGTAPKCIEVSGDVELASGTWTHVKLGNGSVLRRYRLYVKVGGNMTIGSDAKIDASMLGYTQVYSSVSDGLAPTRAGVVAGTFASCGGWSDDRDDPSVTGLLPYGSVTAPEDPGNASGWLSQGGGVIRLDVAGALTVNGAILSETTGTHNGGTGGSIYIHAASISGTGRISADSIINYSAPTTSGGGGRIAVILTGEGADFSSFNPLERISAVCTNKANGAVCTSPGTVYVETKADTANEGWLIINGGTVNPKSRPICCAAAVAGLDGGTVHFSKISLLNGAKALVLSGTTLDIRGTTIEGADSSVSRKGFYLYGGTLIAPDDWTFTDVIFSRGGTIQTPKATFAAGSALTNDVGATELSFTGDLVVNGAMGVVTCLTTFTGGLAEPVPLILNVASSMTIAADGVLDVTGKGYGTRKGPADGQNWNQTYGIHGGMTAGNTAAPYGSIRNPIEAGTASAANSGSYYGGGVVKLVVGGALTNNGVVRASAPLSTYGSAGGSVNVRAGSLAGSGVFNADAGLVSQNDGSGGGRVAIGLADEGADFSDFTGTITAYGGHKNVTNGKVGGAGTVWLKTGDQTDDEGTLIVANELSTYTMNDKAWTSVGGTYMATDELAFGDVIIGTRGWLDLAADKEMTVSGDFINGSKFVANAGSTVRFVGEETSCISGNVTFVNVACEVEGKKLEVADGSVIKITGECGIVGPTEEPIMMYSPVDTTWTLDNSASSVVLEGVALSNCQATAGLTVKNGINLGGNSANISFITISGSELLTWTGAADADWNNPANWDLNRLPLAADKVAIPATAPLMPETDVDLTVAELAVSNGASFNFGSQTLTVNGPVTFAGSLVTTEGAVLKVSGDCAITGSVVPDTLAVQLLGDAAQAFTANGQTFVSLTALAPETAFAGDFTADTLTIGDGTAAFAATFAADEKVTLADFIVRGLSAQACSLACAADDATWKLSSSLTHVAAVTVSGSDATLGQPVYPSADAVNGGNNSSWMFDVTVSHWNGTAWTPAAPTAESVAWIDGGATLTAAEPLTVGRLVVDRTATLKAQAGLSVVGDLVLGGLVELSAPGSVGGDVELVSGATLTHAQNVNDETYKLDLTVAGDIWVRKDAAIDVSGKGYSGGADSGPGSTPKVDGTVCAAGASYGGRGYTGTWDAWGTYPATEYSRACYGSVLCPTNCGSCGAYIWTSKCPGGGVIRLTCAGVLRVDGTIASDSKSGGAACGGSGGSVWLTVGALEGEGIIRANACTMTDNRVPAGGGGRVAVYLTDGEVSFDRFGGMIQAFGGTYNGAIRGSAGTVYLQTAAEPFGEGVLKVVNATASGYRLADDGTDLPGGLYSIPKETKKMRVEAATGGTVNLTGDATIRDISLLDTKARLKLNGHKLTVLSRRHAISPDDATQVDTGDGGSIEWQNPGLLIFVR